MIKVHLQRGGSFFLAMIIVWALCVFSPAIGRCDEESGATGQLKTLDEIVKTLPAEPKWAQEPCFQRKHPVFGGQHKTMCHQG